MKRSTTLQRTFWLAGGATSLLLLAAHAEAQSTEARVKAAFLYNFAKYVDWPSSALEDSGTLVIGIVGTDSLDGCLDQLVSGKMIANHRLVVRHLGWHDDLSQCHELFVPSNEMSGASHLGSLRNKPILVVGESPGFARRYGEINFVEEGNRIRFEINRQASSDAGLKLSSKLLSLGKPPS